MNARFHPNGMSMKDVVLHLVSILGEQFNVVNASVFAVLMAVNVLSIFHVFIAKVSPYIIFFNLLLVLIYNAKQVYDRFKKKRNDDSD